MKGINTMKKYHIICHLTSKGWQIASDYEKMTNEPIRLQRDFHSIISTLAEKMSQRNAADPAPFKIVISFSPCEDRRHYRQRIDYKANKLCPATYAHYGLELYNILKEELGDK